MKWGLVAVTEDVSPGLGLAGHPDLDGVLTGQALLEQLAKDRILSVDCRHHGILRHGKSERAFLCLRRIDLA